MSVCRIVIVAANWILWSHSWRSTISCIPLWCIMRRIRSLVSVIIGWWMRSHTLTVGRHRRWLFIRRSSWPVLSWISVSHLRVIFTSRWWMSSVSFVMARTVESGRRSPSVMPLVISRRITPWRRRWASQARLFTVDVRSVMFRGHGSSSGRRWSTSRSQRLSHKRISTISIEGWWRMQSIGVWCSSGVVWWNEARAGWISEECRRWQRWWQRWPECWQTVRRETCVTEITQFIVNWWWSRICEWPAIYHVVI